MDVPNLRQERKVIVASDTAFLDGAQPDACEVAPRPQSRALVCLGGRPKLHPTPLLTEQVCDLIMGGMTVRAVGAKLRTPSASTIRQWIREDEAFRRAYLRAKEGLLEDKLEEILEFAADDSKDNELTEDAEGMPVVKPNKESLGRSALKISTQLTFIAKMAPRKYGDNPDLLEPPEPARNGDDAKVIEGEAIPLDEHPLRDQILAWERASKEQK